MATEKNINGNVYRCEMLPAEDGLKLLFRTMALFRAAPELMNSLIDPSADLNPKGALVMLALSDPDLDPDKSVALLVRLIGLCTTGGDPAILGHKPESMEEGADVAWFAMEAQFRAFLLASLAKS